jgi:hypothetical protein
VGPAGALTRARRSGGTCMRRASATGNLGAFATLARDGLGSLRRPGSRAATTHVCAPASNELGPSGFMFVRKTQVDMATLHCN